MKNIGFLFGAGTSFEAGYPMMKQLTIKIFENLEEDEISLIEGILKQEKNEYDFTEGYPDVETIFDYVYKYHTSTNDKKYLNLKNSLKKNIFEVIKSIETPNLIYHIKFINALKKINGNNSNCVHIFTPNYDLLFESAGFHSRIPIVNGFVGIFNRYFDVNRFKLMFGTSIMQRRFKKEIGLKINLIKLHGSISWFKKEGIINETGNYMNNSYEDCLIIPPRKKKIEDSLDSPYSSLFRYTSQTIGRSKCKYIVSCGYSFRDDHINDQLIIPKLREGKVKFFALFKDLPENIEIFTQFPNFHYLSENESYFEGVKTVEQSNLWKFSNFVNEIAQKGGLS